MVSGCASMSGQAKDPWNRKYIHFSGKYELVFEHFAEKMVSVDTFEIPRSDKDRPRMSFFAEIKENKLVYQALREADCRVEFRIVDTGIILDNFCHGTGEDAGLYHFMELK